MTNKWLVITPGIGEEDADFAVGCVHAADSGGKCHFQASCFCHRDDETLFYPKELEEISIMPDFAYHRDLTIEPMLASQAPCP